MIIFINPISYYQDKIFIIVFPSSAEIALLKKAYKNYENIIQDLFFDSRNVLIKNETSHLIYVCKFYKIENEMYFKG
jgi:hypothetical protein